MNPFLIPVLQSIIAAITKYIPDPVEKAKAELDLVKSAQEGELKTVLAQLEINAKEAAHPSVFVAGWRPFFGWCSGVGFLYSTIVQPLLHWYAVLHGMAPPPELNVDLLWVVITGMLGIGMARTVEKVRGAAK